MLISRDLIWFVSNSSCTRLDLVRLRCWHTWLNMVHLGWRLHRTWSGSPRMLVAYGLIFTYLHTYLDLPLITSFVGIRISLGISYFFYHFLPSERSSWRSCSSQAFWLWFSCFRQSHIWHSMQMLCNVSFMYDHAWMKCPCIKFIFHLLFSSIRFAASLIRVHLTGQLF